MPRSARIGLLALLLFAGCKDGGETGRDEGAKPAGGTRDGQASAPTLAQRAVAFAAAPGAKSPERIDWPTVLIARRLASIALMKKMMAEDPAAFVATAAGDPIAKAIATMSKLDVPTEARAQAESFRESYAGASDCIASTPNNPPLSDLDDAVEAKLVPELKSALQQVQAGQAFEVRCGRAMGMVVFGGNGSIVAFEPPRANDLDSIDADNRFVRYMNEPDESTGRRQRPPGTQDP